MNALKVKRYYEIKQQMRELETEAEMLNKEIKDEMIQKNMKGAIVGDYKILLQRQDRSDMDDSIVDYLKESGHRDLIIETYDREKFKELEKKGVFDETKLKNYRIEKIFYFLYVKPC